MNIINSIKLRYLVIVGVSLHAIFILATYKVVSGSEVKYKPANWPSSKVYKISEDPGVINLHFVKTYISVMNKDSRDYRIRKKMFVPELINAKRKDELARYLFEIYKDEPEDFWNYGLPLLAGGNGFFNVVSDKHLKNKDRWSIGYGEIQHGMATWIEERAFKAGDIKVQKLKGKSREEKWALLLQDWQYNVWLQRWYVRFLRQRYKGNHRQIFSAYTAGMSVADDPKSTFRNKRIEYLTREIVKLREFDRTGVSE